MVAQKRALRASCDNCHQAKVKCVSTSAGCQRCLSLNVLCVHSPPGRSGRVPAASRDRDRSSHENNNNSKEQSCTIHDPGVSAESEDDNIAPQVSLPTPPPAASALSTPPATEFPTDSLALIDEPMDLMLSSWLPMNHQQSLHDDPGSTPTGRSSIPSTVTSATESISSTSSLFNQPTTPVFGMPLPISTAMADFATREPGMVPQRTSQASLNYHHLLSPKGAGLTCTCFQSIIRALEKIQKANMPSLSLDVALGQNKEALMQICNSLKCTFPHDSTTRLLTMVLLRRNLHVYHLLYQLRLRNEAETNTSNSELFSPSSHSLSPFTFPSLRQGFGTGGNRHYDYNFPTEQLYQEKDTTSSVPGQGSTRLTLGAYQLDDADESSLKKQILLLDVNKVPLLLERLDRRACGLDETDGLDLYNMMRSALIAEFRAIVTAVEA
ncbi:hypothetical protein BGW36DRAFT_432278 [Talaromyces proteolyticus]|uniref:Zn(2)-C6 fungal-type domain-containing protein n=1 Tax=Talaromyces proteolyticus TaxID=1131652 RepID=A0AAD4KFH3_9EURO|nr:uncharacterized protein BGW36DRAFT_432278 [Talaromyces proteolyticus]KAH8690476.1 hypothetical protein BGW36DRAFT_432278 [Talaromyces proteolyticus]